MRERERNIITSDILFLLAAELGKFIIFQQVELFHKTK